jgi:hypothetical protein
VREQRLVANVQSIHKSIDSDFRISIFVSSLALGAFLCVFVPVALVVCVFLGGVSIWVVFTRPISVLGIVLAIMPFHFLPVMIGQFYGVPHMTIISACSKEVPLLLLLYVLGRRNGFNPTMPDWFLMACVSLACLRTAFGGDPAGLWLDFEFIIAYALGRTTVLSQREEDLWAKTAVWIAAVVSVLGLVEVLAVGDGPRKILYLLTTGDEYLPDSFMATGFAGFRAASTMIGPPSLGALCMVALIIWWLYMRNPIPAALICAGLISALTRSTWIGAAAAILVLAYRLGQKRRLLISGAVLITAFIASIPFLGIGDYLSLTRSGQDESERVHRESELRGIQYVIANPMGTGAGSVGPLVLARDQNAVVTENTYLAFAAEYGMPASLCFVGFLLSAVRLSWRSASRLGNLALGILIAFGLMMTVFLAHGDFRLGCWVWFPIGLAIRSCSNFGDSGASGRRGIAEVGAT